MFKGVYYIVQIAFYKGNSNFQFHLPQSTVETAHFSKHSWISEAANTRDGCTDYWSQSQEALLSTLAFQLCDWDGPLVSPHLSFSLFTSTLLSSSLLFACPVPSPAPSNFCFDKRLLCSPGFLKIGAILCSSLPTVCIRGICLHAQVTFRK